VIAAPEAGRESNDILHVTAQLFFNDYSRGAVELMPNWDESQMLDGLRSLDAQAIGIIYDRYSADVYRYARYRLNDEHLAEDIASDVFVQLLEALQNGRGPQSNVKAWLLSTAAHIVTDQLRRAYRRPTTALPEDLADRAATPVDEFESRERSRDFRRAYARLTDEQQHVLALRFGEGFSLEETAAVLKKKINAVKALQFRALAALQRNIGEGRSE
jgi:RNA polymerase sigma-70 factor (ECF subfamily)